MQEFRKSPSTTVTFDHASGEARLNGEIQHHTTEVDWIEWHCVASARAQAVGKPLHQFASASDPGDGTVDVGILIEFPEEGEEHWNNAEPGLAEPEAAQLRAAFPYSFRRRCRLGPKVLFPISCRQLGWGTIPHSSLPKLIHRTSPQLPRAPHTTPHTIPHPTALPI